VSGRVWARARQAADAVAWGLFGGLGLATRLGIGRVAPLDPASVRRILVIRLDLLGDLVFSAPTIAALRAAYPAADLTLLTLPYTRPLAVLIPGVDRTLALDVNCYRRPAGWRHLGEAVALVRRLRAAHYDLCLALHGRPAGVLALVSGARYRVGYAAHAYPFAFNVPVGGRRYARRQHEAEYCLDLARAVGADGPAVPRLLAPEGGYRVSGLAAGKRYVVLHPGASNGSAKRWPAASWGRLARAAAEALDVGVVLTGGEAERALVETVAAEAGAAAVPVVGTSLLELAALLAGAEAVVSGDTGPLHLAAALGRPALGVYGPTDPAQTGPLGERTAVVRRLVPCGPCYDLRGPAECKLPDRSLICMRELEPDAVLDALVRLLDAGVMSAVEQATPEVAAERFT
jgi:lipopolysaccharide heptosyltransferase II